MILACVFCVHFCFRFHIWNSHWAHINLCSMCNTGNWYLDWFYHERQLVNCFCVGVSLLMTVTRGEGEGTEIWHRFAWLPDPMHVMSVMLVKPLFPMVAVMIMVFVTLLMLLPMSMAVAVFVFMLVVLPSIIFLNHAHSSIITFLPHLCHSDDLAGHSALPQAWSSPHPWHLPLSFRLDIFVATALALVLGVVICPHICL